MSATPETDALYAQMLAENPGNFIHLEEFLELACRLARERNEALMDRASGDIATMTRNHYERLIKERDEARQRASDLALGVKVADCMYDYGKYSVELREAKIKARYLQELTRAAYDEVEKLEDQEGAK
jgi:hypothetical protein